MSLEEYFKLIVTSVSDREIMVRTVYHAEDLDNPYKHEKFTVQSVYFTTMVNYDYNRREFTRNTDLSKSGRLKVTFKNDKIYQISLDNINSMKIIKGDEFPFEKNEVLDFLKKKSMRALVEENI